jgi:hypothetical protein
MRRRDELFIMRINSKERELIAALAEREGTSASEAVRFVIRQAAQQHGCATPRQEVSASAGVTVRS